MKIGILGGMGPLASAGFVNFLYQKCQKKFTKEQHYPHIILISDPSIPDRLDYANAKENEKIATILENKIQDLVFLDTTHIMLCCFTAHYFIPFLSKESQSNLIHLGLVLTKHLEQSQKPTLILCSKLTMESKFIHSQYAIYPEETHFPKIHDLIYKIKLNGPDQYKNALIALSEELGKLYQVNRVLFACTEFHLIYQTLTQQRKISSSLLFLDGLDIAANFIINICCRK